MLKIGNVRWKGNCAKHPLYNPAEGGESAIKGGCARCQSLLELYRHHATLVRMMRALGPPDDRPKKEPRPRKDVPAQALLFD